MKSLVVFYSLEGNTRFAAGEIADAVGAHLLELKPKQDIKARGLLKYFWGGKQVFMKATPELESFGIQPEDYDVIYIGTPVWAGSFTPAIATFFKIVKLKAKKIALFCCHRGRPGGTLEKMKNNLAGNEVVGEKDFIEPGRNREENREKIRSWAKEIMAKIEG